MCIRSCTAPKQKGKQQLLFQLTYFFVNLAIAFNGGINGGKLFETKHLYIKKQGK